MADQASAVIVERASVSFGSTPVVDDVTFVCRRGQWTLLAGPSGAGKTTLLRAMNGLCPISRGSITVLGSCLPGRTRHAARSAWRQTGTVLQEIALFETRSVRGNVELGLRAAGRDRAKAKREARQWLERFGLDDKLNDHPWSLSGGQRQRVALARAMAPRPSLLLLDEPTSALDVESAKIILDALTELVRSGTTVVMSSHREDEVLSLVDQRVAVTCGTAAAEQVVLDIRVHAATPTPT